MKDDADRVLFWENDSQFKQREKIAMYDFMIIYRDLGVVIISYHWASDNTHLYCTCEKKVAKNNIAPLHENTFQ